MKFDPSIGLTDEEKSIQESAFIFAEKEMKPHVAKWDEEKIFPKDLYRKAAEMGFASVYLKEDHGGMGMTRKQGTIIFEALATACASTTSYLTVHNMASWMIDEFGTEAQRAKFLPRLTSLEQFASYCLTEPGSGSDAASLATKAEKVGDTYVLNGTKAFISGAGQTDVYIVMARTGGPGPKGISAFIVEKGTPGLTFGAPEKKMGWHSHATAMVNLDNVTVPAENLIGGVEGKGFTFAMKGLDGGRINIAALSVGGAQAAFNAANSYVAERRQFGAPLNALQGVQFKLADMATDLTAARLMIHRAADLLDAKSPEASLHCAMAKRFATDAGSAIANDALQLHGGYGYLRDFPVEKIVRDLRVHQILEGANDVMRVIIGRQITKD